MLTGEKEKRSSAYVCVEHCQNAELVLVLSQYLRILGAFVDLVQDLLVGGQRTDGLLVDDEAPLIVVPPRVWNNIFFLVCVCVSYFVLFIAVRLRFLRAPRRVALVQPLNSRQTSP